MQLYEALLSRLKTQHLAVPEIIKGLDQRQLLLPVVEDKWNIHQNIAHLARYQQIFINRVEAMLTNDRLFFDRYVAAEDEQFAFFTDNSTKSNVDHINRHRGDILNLVQSLAANKSAHLATHAKFGPMDITQWTEFFLLHEAHHLYTIFQLAQAVRQT